MPSVTTMDSAKSTQPISPHYLSSRTADALISDLRPTSLSAQSLTHLNLLLDELLTLLIQSSQSIDPKDIKTKGISGIFGGASLLTKNTDERSPPSTPTKTKGSPITPTRGSKSLGRDAIGEAEVELKAWRDSRKTTSQKEGFLSFPRGMMNGLEGLFPLEEAVNMLRCKILTLSTLSTEPLPIHMERAAIDSWHRAGGCAVDEVIAPAALYVTAIIEHICEHILTNIGRVIERDSSSSTAMLEDLYIALCEDEAVWGFFKGMQVKSTIEKSLRTSGVKASRIAPPVTGTPGVSSTVDKAAMTFTRTPGIQGPSAAYARQSSYESAARGSGSSGNARQPSDSPGRGIKGVAHHRTSSIISATTRHMLGAYNEQTVGTRASTETGRDDASYKVATEDFDELVKSGQTMKVSLTPSRLKNFEASGLGANVRTATTPSFPPSPTQSSKSTGAVARSTPTNLSSRRLVPKDTPVNDDDENEELSDRPTPAKKESLIDILSAEPPWGAAAKSRVTAGSGAPRQVPAVVVGRSTPPTLGPPVESHLTISPSQTRLQPSNPTTLPEADDALAYSKPRPKTSTQELADFFKHEPPPLLEPSGPPRRPSAESTGQKPRRFKTLVNRITGRSPSNTNLRGEYDDVQVSGIARKKSLGGRSSNEQSMPTLPPSAFRGTVSQLPPTRPSPWSDRPLALDDQVIQTAPVPAILPRSDSLPTSENVEDDAERQLSLGLAPGTAVNEEVMVTRGVAVAATTIGAAEDASASSNAPATEETAARGTPAEPAEVAALVTPAPRCENYTSEEQGAVPSASEGPEGAVSPVGAETGPTIPLQNLASLRGLLAHATTANECRMLVNAVLLLWKVPKDNDAAESPESRVAAWLLAGRDGPPATPSNHDRW